MSQAVAVRLCLVSVFSGAYEYSQTAPDLQKWGPCSIQIWGAGPYVFSLSLSAVWRCCSTHGIPSLQNEAFCSILNSDSTRRKLGTTFHTGTGNVLCVLARLKYRKYVMQENVQKEYFS